jgi:hypothetical protein
MFQPTRLPGAIAAISVLWLIASAAHAEILKVEVAKIVSPVFDGVSFGDVGQYERVDGWLYGVVDPKDPLNGDIADIAHAPRNADGMVEYRANFMVFRPVDPAKGNRKVLYEINNRGNVLTFALLNDAAKENNDPLTAADAGNGWMMRQGYTIALSGWDAVSPRTTGTGGGPLVLDAPVARNSDGSSIVGPSLEEFIIDNTTTTEVQLTYSAADTNPANARLMVRTLVDDTPTPIDSGKWQFGGNGMSIGLRPTGTAFEAGKIYDLVYQARDPRIAGLGYPAVRDFADFLKSHAESVAPGATEIYATCVSQPCRYLHDYVELGFNRAAGGGPAIDGILNWVGGASGIYLNYRFAEPFRTHRQRINRWYPEFEFPFAYHTLTDKVTGKTGGWLDRCKADNSCPLILDANSENEYWAKNGALVHVDTEGKDLADIDGVRLYLVTGRPHGGGIPASGKGICAVERNPLVGNQAMRALLVALDEWVTKGTLPPDSLVPRASEGMLTDSSQASVAFPAIPGVAYTGRMHTGDLFDYGPETGSGILTVLPPTQKGTPYPALVPATDADGNVRAGIRLPDIAVPIGTYTGWNNRANPPADGCDHTGLFVPFAKTKSEREATGDPRLSLEERYADHAAYVAAVKEAAKALVEKRLLLREDADAFVAAAEASDIGN